MLAGGSADDHYADASKQLRKQLGNNKVYEAANAWAIKLCKEAQQADQWQVSHKLSQQEKRHLRDWKPAAKAARFLARHLSGGLEVFARVEDAANQAGLKLIPDKKEAIDVAFTNMLRKLADQPVSLHCRPRCFLHGPLLVIPPDKRFRFPSKSMSLAIALIYGFQRMSGATECRPEPSRYHRGLYIGGRSYHRFDLLSGGEPCYEAATLFANFTFDADAESDASTTTKWLRSNKCRVYVLMDDITVQD